MMGERAPALGLGMAEDGGDAGAFTGDAFRETRGVTIGASAGGGRVNRGLGNARRCGGETAPCPCCARPDL